MSGTPVAVIIPSEQEVVVGSIVKVDGRSSIDPNHLGLSYDWSISQVPIGSQVQQFGLTSLEDDSSIVSFAPDIVGIYKLQLTVSDGITDSVPVEAIIDVRAILVPHHQGIVPDASFIWNYLSDFWNLVPDKKRFETIWSSMIQVVSSEMLKVFEYQYNRSIRDIQETIQKRWISFSPSLELDRNQISFILSEETAGTQASTFVIDAKTAVPIPDQPTHSNIITVPISEGNLTKTSFNTPTALGRLIRLGSRTFTISRTGNVFLSLLHNFNGITSGPNVFSGSQFTSNMVGCTLRLLGSSVLAGDYIISTVINGSHLLISNPPIGVTWGGFIGLEYSIISPVVLNTAAFADTDSVPAALQFQSWRMSSTLISTQYDFEAQGVSIGDVIEVEIFRVDLQVLSTFFIQVTAVDRNRLSFSFNLEDLVDGVAADGLTDDIQVTLASDLIVSGLSSNIDGSLVYSLDADLVRTTITSKAFKKTYFETELTTLDEIDVGAFTITARPVRVIRNSKIAVDSGIVSIPILQEYIKQPDLVFNNNSIFIVANDVQTQIPRTPYLLAENLDYIIDDESTITGTCQTQQASDLIVIPFGDLLDRSISEGDVIEVVQGTTAESFDILKIVSADTLQVSPIATITSTAALFTIFRKVTGKFIRFIDGTFSKSAPAPSHLWAEVAYLDNNPSIEGNFGILVGVKREDLQRVDSGLSYRNAVAGLMYALSRGPTISNLALASHILIGLPFTQSAGIISEINPTFRTRSDGSPLTGRILVDAIDKNKNRTGITNIYFYPQGRQVFDSSINQWVPAVPDLSGIAINPTTNIPYAVGDAVDQFTPLAKGVVIQDYRSDAGLFDNLVAQGNITFDIRKFHSFRAVINSDLITATDTDLVVQFLRKAKAHYINLISSLQLSFADTQDIDDPLSFIRNIHLFENPSLGTPTAVRVDQKDDDQAVLSLDGVFYTRYQYGSDLVTTQGSTTVSSPSGGFINPRTGNHESWDPPLIRPGHLLQIVSGPNIGRYSITSVTSDTQFVLTLPSTTFQTLSGQDFIVYRPLTGLIWSGLVSVANGNATIPVQESDSSPGGIGAAGVSVGDTLVFSDVVSNPVVSKNYRIIEVDAGNSPHIIVSTPPSETSGNYVAWVVRKGLLTNGFITPVGSTGEHFFISGTINTSVVLFSDVGLNKNSWLNLALLHPGSRILIDSDTYEVLQFNPSTRQTFLFSPLAATYTNKSVSVDLRPDRPSTPVSTNFLDRIPSDFLELDLVASLSVGDTAITTSGSPNVSLNISTFSSVNAIPGDYLQLLTGADSTRDVGLGAGIFPIQTLTGTVATLPYNLTANGNFRYAIIRKIPNDG